MSVVKLQLMKQFIYKGAKIGYCENFKKNQKVQKLFYKKKKRYYISFSIQACNSKNIIEFQRIWAFIC